MNVHRKTGRDKVGQLTRMNEVCVVMSHKLMKDDGDLSIYDSSIEGTKIRNRIGRRLEW